jgi:putative DNA primase/helicase
MTEKPTGLLTQESIPDELVERPQWVCWRRAERDGKPTKIPVVPGVGSFASSTDPETWADFETAHDYLERGRADGIGFVFTEHPCSVNIESPV